MPSSRIRRMSRKQGGRLLRVHAGRRLVEEQQRRLRGQRPGDLQPSLRPVGQVLGQLAGVAPEAHVLQQRQAPVAHVLLLARGSRRAQHDPEHAALRAAVPAHHDVLQRRHLVEEADVLEGARDAQPGDLRREHAGDLATLEADGARRGPVDAGDGVEQRGLAGPVGADQPDDLVLVGVEVDLVDGDEAAERLDQLCGLEDPHGISCRHRTTPAVPVRPRPCCRVASRASRAGSRAGPAGGRP